MLIYAGVDGTSDENDEQYKVTFEKSFVNQLQHQFEKSFYHRGPYTWGMDTAAYARKAFDFVVAHYQPGDCVFLAGYSRGGAAAIEIAYWLKYEKKIPVECLILFDPVDRSTTLGRWGFRNTPIVDTVRKALYFQRNKWTTRSRISFGNCGYTKENDGMEYFYQQFHATHGGVGGVPWTEAVNPYTGEARDTIWEYGEIAPTTLTPDQDDQGAKMVWTKAKSLITIAKQEAQQRNAPPVTINPPAGRPVAPLPGGGSPGGGYPGGGAGERVHIVQPGDWLSKIAIKYYGDMNQWHKIYNHPANRQVIGNNPDLIEPNMRLVIPA